MAAASKSINHLTRRPGFTRCTRRRLHRGEDRRGRRVARQCRGWKQRLRGWASRTGRRLQRRIWVTANCRGEARAAARTWMA
uniref:Uncharacterized protein n=1 Tax=Cucumis sativus TaxID=3659 RepID=A0A0A0LZF4_CUCSA